MKRLLIITILSVAARILMAANVVFENVYYLIWEEHGYALVDKRQDGTEYQGDINIAPAITYNGYTYVVRGLCHEVFQNCKNITSITIPSSVDAIGKRAFKGCVGLTSIDLSDNLIALYPEAFADCSNLKHVDLGRKLKNIEQQTFQNCTNLSSVFIPGSVRNIGDSAFANCSNLSCFFQLPEGLEKIGVAAFMGCVKLRSLKIPGSVSNIGKDAFKDVLNIKYVGDALLSDRDNCPWGALSLGDYYVDDQLVYENSSKKEIVAISATATDNLIIPESVRTVALGALRSDALIENIKNPLYNSYVFVYCPINYTGNYKVPKGIEKIGPNAFASCESLYSVKLPESVREIGIAAFGGCADLTTINIPDKIKLIEEYAFAACTSLVSIKLPDGITSIKDYAFFHCTNLESIILPQTIQKIGFAAFAECEKLTAITIPQHVKEIYGKAFAGCNNLASITCLAVTPPKLFGDYDLWDAFGDVPKNIPLYVPAESVGAYKEAMFWKDFQVQEKPSSWHWLTTVMIIGVLIVVLGLLVSLFLKRCKY